MKYKKKYLRLIGKLTGGMDSGEPEAGQALVGPEAGQAQPEVKIEALQAMLESVLEDTTPEGRGWDYPPNLKLIEGVDEILRLNNDGDIKYLIFKDGIWQKLLMPLDYSGTNNEAVEADAKHDYVTHLNQIKKEFGGRTPQFQEFMEQFKAGLPRYRQEFKEFQEFMKKKKKPNQTVAKLTQEFIDKKKIECSQYSPAFNKLKQEYIGKSTVDEKDTLNRQLAKKTGKYMVGINTPSLSSVMQTVETFLEATKLATDHGHAKESVKDGIKDSSYRIWNAVLTTDKPLSSYNNEMEHADTLLGLFDQNREVNLVHLLDEQVPLLNNGTSIKISKYPLEDGFLISVIQTRRVPPEFNTVKNFRYLIKIDNNGSITSCGEFEGGGEIPKILKDVEYDEKIEKFVLTLTNGDPIYVDFSVIMKLKTEGDAATLAGCIIENAAGASHDNLVFVRAINSQTFNLDDEPILQGGLSMMMIIKTEPKKQNKQNQKAIDAASVSEDKKGERQPGEVGEAGVKYDDMSEEDFKYYTYYEEYSADLLEDKTALKKKIVSLQDELGDLQYYLGHLQYKLEDKLRYQPDGLKQDELGQFLQDELGRLPNGLELLQSLQYELEYLPNGLELLQSLQDKIGPLQDEIGLLEDELKNLEDELQIVDEQLEDFLNDDFNKSYFKEEDDEMYKKNYQEIYEKRKRPEAEALESTYNLTLFKGGLVFSDEENIKLEISKKKAKYKSLEQLSIELKKQLLGNNENNQNLKAGPLGGKRRNELTPTLSSVLPPKVSPVLQHAHGYPTRLSINPVSLPKKDQITPYEAAQMIYSLIITFNYRNRDVGLFIKTYMKDNKSTILPEMTDVITALVGKVHDINTMLINIANNLIASIEATLIEKKATLNEEIKVLKEELGEEAKEPPSAAPAEERKAAVTPKEQLLKRKEPEPESEKDLDAMKKDNEPLDGTGGGEGEKMHDD